MKELSICFLVLTYYKVTQISASKIISSNKCFEQKFRGIEEKIELFSDELGDMREEIGHLSLGISALIDHFKITSMPLVGQKHKRIHQNNQRKKTEIPGLQEDSEIFDNRNNTSE